MDTYLVEILVKIEGAQREGRQYFYKREESNDPHGDVAALKELERCGYITCGRFIPDNEGPGGYYAIGGPCRLEFAAQKLLRELHAQPHIRELQGIGNGLPAMCTQTLEHLAQAAKQLTSIDNERARKDAVRDCLSGLESLLKSLTHTSDIKEATTSLRAKGGGPDTLVKDGLSIWDHIHRLYPDVRHGQTAISTMSKAEALYWVERITAFIRYVSSVFH
jgi:hypothetical protein